MATMNASSFVTSQNAVALRAAIEDSFAMAAHYNSLGVLPLRGCLIIGMQGAGKTRLVRNAMTEVDVRCIEVSILDVIITGQNNNNCDNKENLLYKAFSAATTENTPLVIFMDDVDMLSSGSDNDNEDKVQKLTRTLESAFGKLKPTTQVLVIATASDVKALPPVFLQSGLFERRIQIDTPDRHQRRRLIEPYLRQYSLDPISQDHTFVYEQKNKSQRKYVTTFSAESLLSPVQDDNEQNMYMQWSHVLSQVTAGYVIGDIIRLLRQATLHRLSDITHQSTPFEQLDDELSRLSMDDANTTIMKPLKLTWSNISYALDIIQPSQAGDTNSSEEIPLARKGAQVSWDQVGGYAYVKQQLQTAVWWPVQHALSFERLGVRPPSGVLLYGPSGCGKTMLVQALATSLSSLMNFIMVKGSELFSRYFGDSELNMRQIFTRACKLAPCIIFFDELDAIATCREQEDGETNAGVNERVLSTLLNEMDGVSSREGVVVLACTNRPDKIDDAVLRPGRMDQLVYVPLPSLTDRGEILRALSRTMAIHENVNWTYWAEKTDSWTGADLRKLLREAGLICLQRGLALATCIDHEAIQMAFERMIGGSNHSWKQRHNVELYERFANIVSK